MRVLIAMDSSEFCRNALQTVLERPWWGDTHFLILSVVQTLSPALSDWTYSADFDRFFKEERESAKTLVYQAAEQLRKALPNLNVEVLVGEGNVCENIINQARDWHADLIVMGSHGRRGLDKFLLGSVAEAVLHRADCSVEIVKPHPAIQQAKSQVEKKQLVTNARKVSGRPEF